MGDRSAKVQTLRAAAVTFPENAARTEARNAQAEGLGGGRASEEAKPKMAALGPDRAPRASTPTAQRHLTSFAEPHPHPPRGGLASPSCVAADWLPLWSLSASLLRVERARTRKVASAGPGMYACAIN